MWVPIYSQFHVVSLMRAEVMSGPIFNFPRPTCTIPQEAEAGPTVVQETDAC